MADTYPNDVVIAGSGFLRLSVATLNGSDITSFGTAIDLKVVSAEKSKYANFSKDTEYITKRTTAGVDVRAAKTDVTINAGDGSVAASGTNADEMTCEVAVGKTDRAAIIAALRDSTKRIAALRGIGVKASDHSQVGFEHIIGKISGDLEFNSAEDIQTFSITIKGGETFTSTALYSAYNTAMTTATITPVGKSAITPKALSSGDYANLISGKLVYTDPS